MMDPNAYTRDDLPTGCLCHPCDTPGYGAPGYAHCAACCYGSGIGEYDPDCLIEGHAELGRRSHGIEAPP